MKYEHKSHITREGQYYTSANNAYTGNRGSSAVHVCGNVMVTREASQLAKCDDFNIAVN